MANLVILTADQLKALDPLERQAARRAARQQPLVRLILNIFLQHGGPVAVERIIAASPDGPAEALRDALVTLDDEDILRVHAGQIDLAYPFATGPTPFLVRLARGRERFACCATDALGVAPMVGEPVQIASSCHHCGESVEIAAAPHGVRPGAEGVMVWFGRRGDDGCKAFDSL